MSGRHRPTALRRAGLITIVHCAIALALPGTGAMAQAPAASAPAAAVTPVQPLDLFALEQVVAPQVSPDGRRILYLRQTRDIMTDTVNHELWLVNADGTDRRLLVGAKQRPGSARWSPDGRRIAYLGTVGSEAQIHVLDLADGIGRPVTRLEGGAGTPNWAPNGQAIAFSAFVEAKATSLYTLPDKPKGATWAAPARQIADIQYRSDSGGWGTPGRNHVFVVDLASQTSRQVTEGPFDHGGDVIAWTPDSQTLVFAANRSASADLEPVENDLWAVPAGGGTLRQITSLPGTEAAPVVSPDGRTIAYVGWQRRDTSYQRTDIFTVPLAGGPSVNLTLALDREASSPTWSADGRRLSFLYLDQGVGKVGEIAATGGTVRTLVPAVGATRLLLPSSGGAAYSAAAGTIAYQTIHPDKPAGLGVRRGTSDRLLVDLNAGWRATKAIGRMEEIWVTSVGNQRVQGWILYPPDFDPSRRYPLALDIHGGPHIDYGPGFSITHHLYAAAGYVTLFANPRGSVGYGEAFANLINRAYPGNDHDDLMALVDAVVARGYIDERNLFIGGGSGGGVLTAWAIGKTDRFRAAAVKRPVINWTSFVLTSDIMAYTSRYWLGAPPWTEGAQAEYWRRSPLSLVGNVRTPTILITGQNDFRTPMSETEQYYQALRLNGVDAAMVELAEANHGFGRPSQWLQAILATVQWYDRHRVK